MNPVIPRTSTLAGAIHSHCNCLKCRLGYAAWLRERKAAIKNGTWQPWTDAAPARAHIERLHADGMPYVLISRLSGIPNGEISRIRGTVGKRARTERIRPATARALLGVQLHFSHLPDTAHVPAKGTRRRVQALRALGWPPYVLVALTGLGPRSMYTILVEENVLVATHRTVSALYEDLRDQDPVTYGVDPAIARRGRRYAARQGWAVPAAWTDIDSDEAPDRKVRRLDFDKPAKGDRSLVVIEQTAELAANGVPRDEIARRIGISWNAIEKAHERADVRVPASEREVA